MRRTTGSNVQYTDIVRASDSRVNNLEINLGKTMQSNVKEDSCKISLDSLLVVEDGISLEPLPQLESGNYLGLSKQRFV